MTEMKIVPQAANSILIEVPGEKRGDPPVIAQIYVDYGVIEVIMKTDMTNKGVILSWVKQTTDGDVFVLGGNIRQR